MMTPFRRNGLALVLFSVTFAAAAHAAPIDYTLNFNVSEGNGPAPVGSFTYDPDVPLFTNFNVVWNGISFDITDAANNPNPNSECGAKMFDPAAGFAILSGATSCPAHQLWRAATNGPIASLVLFASVDISGAIADRSPDWRIEREVAANGVPPSSAAGAFTIAEAATPVPEPTSLVLLSGGLAGLVLRQRRRCR